MSVDLTVGTTVNRIIRGVQPSVTFSPQDPGTREFEWRSFLCQSNEWQPRVGPLIVVAPHPDDEILGAGGLLHAHALAGQKITILSVTDGEAADSLWLGLDRVRRSELRNALRKLSLSHITVYRLGIPDGRVKDYRNRLRSALRECVEDRGTIIAPYELDGHPDHEAAGRESLEVAQSYGVPIARYPVWAWHHAEPTALRAVQWGLFPLEAGAQRAKKRAMQCFESQLRPPRGCPIVPPHVLAHFERPYEAFLL
jgi:LmbE family N-acetylglucosaminyl deacetylase